MENGNQDEAPSRREQLKATLDRAVSLAAEDPDAFLEELKRIAARFGMTLEEVYARLQEDPELRKVIGREALKRGVQGAATFLKGKLGL